MATTVAGLSFRNLERLGERTTGSRMGQISLLAVVALVLFAAPVAAQANCSQGFLGFLAELKAISVQALGLMLFALLAAGVILRAIPMQGTSTAGNVILGGVIAGVVILIIGTAVIDIAGGFTDIDLSSQCSVGGGSGGN
jgi:vacuolar-type H+-ATPase subunit I/STV1